MNRMVRRLSYGTLLLTFFGAAVAQKVVTAPFEPDSGNLTIRCGILIDGVSDLPRTFQTIEIVDGRFSSISSGNADVDLDLSVYTCMPGFIDTHTHIAEPVETANLSIFYTISTAELREASRVNAEITLAAGFTTARNVGSYVGWSGARLARPHQSRRNCRAAPADRGLLLDDSWRWWRSCYPRLRRGRDSGAGAHGRRPWS